MQKLTLLLLAMLALTAVGTFTSGSNFGDDEKELENKCGTLLEGGDSSESGEGGDGGDDGEDGSGSGSGDGDDDGSGSGDDNIPGKYCLLLKYFYNIAIEFKGTAVYKLWLEWIEEIHYTIVLDSSLTIQQKICAIWARLDAFISIHVEIKQIVYYLYIEEWGGYVRNLEAVSVTFSAEISESIWTLDASGSCSFFDAIRNYTAGTEWEAKIEVLITELTVILESSSYSYAYKLVLIYQKLQAFCEANASFKAEFLSIEIEGYGVVGAAFEVCAYYWRAYYFDLAVGGSVSDCALINALIAAYNNASLGSSSQRSQIKQLTDKCVKNFPDLSVEARIQYFYEQLYQFFILQDWSVDIMYSISIEVTFEGETVVYGDLYQLIYAFVLELNLGIDFTNPTTTLPTTTPSASCSNVVEINSFSSNTTALLTAIDEAQATSWNSTDIQRFSTYQKRIYVVSSNSTATLVEKYNNIIKVLQTWTTNTYYLEKVYSVFIATWGGSVEQAISCNSTVNSA